MIEDMENLLDETLSVLAKRGLTPADVEFVALGDRWTTWDNFAAIARDVNYDSGYGIAEIPEGLVVAGRDWWLSRGEYDGSEWWDFNRKPERPQNLLPLDSVRRIQ